MYISAAEEPVTHLPGHSIHKGVAFLYQREARKNIAVIVIPYIAIQVIQSHQRHFSGDSWNRRGAWLPSCHRSI